MNPHTNESKVAQAENSCDLVNQRFGYSAALDYALAALGMPDDERKSALLLARNRELDKFQELIVKYRQK